MEEFKEKVKTSAGDQMRTPSRKITAAITDNRPPIVRQEFIRSFDLSLEPGRNLIRPKSSPSKDNSDRSPIAEIVAEANPTASAV